MFQKIYLKNNSYEITFPFHFRLKNEGQRFGVNFSDNLNVALLGIKVCITMFMKTLLFSFSEKFQERSEKTSNLHNLLS